MFITVVDMIKRTYGFSRSLYSLRMTLGVENDQNDDEKGLCHLK